MMQRKIQIEKLLEDIQILKCKMLSNDTCHLKGGQITASQWLVLQHLRKNEGATIKGISQTLSITSSAATQLVEPLVQKGYINKKANSNDRRALNLSLSSRSKKRMENLRNKRIQRMEQVFDILTDDEFTVYCNLLDKIAGSQTAKK